MTVYRIECHKCTYKAISQDWSIYCLATILGKRSVYIEDGHAGTKEDPDPVCCDYYTTEPRQMVFYDVYDEEKVI